MEFRAAIMGLFFSVPNGKVQGKNIVVFNQSSDLTPTYVPIDPLTKEQLSLHFQMLGLHPIAYEQ